MTDPPSSAEERERPPPPPEQLPALLEALLFVADGPVGASTLAKVFGLTKREIEPSIEELAESLRVRGLRLQRGPEGVQLVTAPMASGYVEQFLGLESAKRLSTAALETLAIIAYRQPVTRAHVEAIRGVNSDAAIDTLRTRGLADIIGRADGPGRPALFATTQRFLEHFGLERPEDLPPLPEEIAGVAAARLTEQAAQLPLKPLGTTVPSATTPVPAQPPLAGEHGPESASDTEETHPAKENGPHIPSSNAALPRPSSAAPPRSEGGFPPGAGTPRIG